MDSRVKVSLKPKKEERGSSLRIWWSGRSEQDVKDMFFQPKHVNEIITSHYKVTCDFMGMQFGH